MAKSTVHANAVLDEIGSGVTIAAATWVSLHTSNPGTTGAGEAAGGSYARVRVNQDGSTSPFWKAAAAAAMANDGAITFPEDGGGATITHVGLWDAATAGNFLRGGTLSQSFVYGATTTPEFATDALELTEA